MTLHQTNNCQIFYNNIFSTHCKLSKAQNLTANLIYCCDIFEYITTHPPFYPTFSFKSIIIECHDKLFLLHYFSFIILMFFCWDFSVFNWCFKPTIHCCTNSLHTHKQQIGYFLMTTLQTFCIPIGKWSFIQTLPKLNNHWYFFFMHFFYLYF